MTTQTGKLTFATAAETTASVHGDGIVILDIGKGRLFASNRTGARIWRGIERQLPLETIAEQIAAEFQIALPTAREHTVRFFGELERHSLIQRRAA